MTVALMVSWTSVSHAQERDVWFGQELASMNRCGPLALQVCAIAAGRATAGTEIEMYLPRNGREWSLSELEWCAREIGLRTLAVQWRDLPRILSAPAIIPIVRSGQNHYVALLGRDGDRVMIVDAPYAPGWISIAELKDRLQWNGYSLHVARQPWSLWAMTVSLYGRTLVLVAAGLLFAGWAVPRLRRARQRTLPTVPATGS